MTAQYHLAKQRSVCAPPYYDVVLAYLQSECVHGEDRFVGSAELHEACSAYICRALYQGDAPTQRELRTLMEQLGYQYLQT
jgi:hypothetical protein